ncbi:MAG TPA: tetratricopeptide repeat protein [Rhizomicrobium sp.]|nr:tetratricopeptide repeat protein [Rhizomicrobium sp.]
MRTPLAILAVISVWAGLAPPAGAASNELGANPDWTRCTSPDTDDDNVLIKACSAVLNRPETGDGDRAVAYKFLCLAYNDKGDHDRAIENCDSALRLKPDFVDVLLFRGHAWFNKAEYDRAIKDYDQAIALGSHAAATFIQRGAAYHRKKDEAHAIEDLSQAIEIDPKDPTAFYIRAVAYEAQKDEAHAIADYGEAIRLAPNFSVALYRRGVLRRAIGDVGGDADIAKARKIDPRIGKVQGHQ